LTEERAPGLLMRRPAGGLVPLKQWDLLNTSDLPINYLVLEGFELARSLINPKFINSLN
jgi:hypothetical protein